VIGDRSHKTDVDSSSPPDIISRSVLSLVLSAPSASVLSVLSGSVSRGEEAFLRRGAFLEGGRGVIRWDRWLETAPETLTDPDARGDLLVNALPALVVLLVLSSAVYAVAVPKSDEGSPSSTSLRRTEPANR
jgi:hypothetical protein